MVCAAPTAGGRYEGQPTCQASSSACFLYRALPCAGGVSLTLPGASGEEESHRLELRTHRAEVVELLLWPDLELRSARRLLGVVPRLGRLLVSLRLRELVQQEVVCLNQAQALLGSDQLSGRRILSVELLGGGVPVFQVLVLPLRWLAT